MFMATLCSSVTVTAVPFALLIFYNADLPYIIDQCSSIKTRHMGGVFCRAEAYLYIPLLPLLRPLPALFRLPLPTPTTSIYKIKPRFSWLKFTQSGS
jgi:hypothetical protein